MPPKCKAANQYSEKYNGAAPCEQVDGLGFADTAVDLRLNRLVG
jgi:hypothetical protein